MKQKEKLKPFVVPINKLVYQSPYEHMSDYVAPQKKQRDSKNIKAKANPFPVFNKIIYSSDEYDRQTQIQRVEKMFNQVKIKNVFRVESSNYNLAKTADSKVFGSGQIPQMKIEELAYQQKQSELFRQRAVDQTKKKRINLVQLRDFKQNFEEQNQEIINRKAGFDTRLFERMDKLKKLMGKKND